MAFVHSPLRRSHWGWLLQLDTFVKAYNARNRAKRKESEQFRRFSYDDLKVRDKLNLDLFWLNDDSLEDTSNLPPPAEIATEIVENLEAALEQFRSVAEELPLGQ